ncbi:MAG: GNAT family N-acetyltransferase [Candidatus Acidiferrales bacterium]
MARVFTESVHAIGAKDYSPEQLAAWAPEPPDTEYWRSQLSRLTGFVAELDSDVVGFVTFSLDGHIHHLYVHSLHQRRGVASALYWRVEEEALASGVRRIFTEASITARPFFERVGFHVVAPQEVVRRGVGLTNYRMERFYS